MRQSGTAKQHERHARLKPAALLILIGLFTFLPGLFAIPAVDRDEARFAQATRQMLESGDYVTPRLGEETRFKKPVGIYWLQAAAVRLAGQNASAPIGTYRLPSVAAALLSAVAVYFLGRHLFGPGAAFAAALLLLASPVLGAEARLAKTDAVQLLAAMIGQYVLMRIYLAGPGAPRRLGLPLAFWAAMGIGILVKGPIVPMLAGLTALALVLWDRKASWLRGLRPGIGVPLMVLIVLPWLIAVVAQSGSDFFRESLGNDLLGKVATGQESHGRPPGFHLLTAVLIYWPGAFVAAAAAPWIWANRHAAAVRFCLAWLVPFWIAFELIVTKLPHYTLPAAPAAFLLAGAAAASQISSWKGGWRRILFAAAAAIGIALAIALPLAFRWLQGTWPSLPALPLGLLAVAAGAMTIRRLSQGEAARALQLLVAEAVMVQLLFFGLLLPQADRLWIAPRVKAAIERLDICADPQLMAAGINEASMLFALGSGLKFGDAEAAADFLREPGCRILILSSSLKPAFDERLRARGTAGPDVLETVSGLNLGSGKAVSLDILAVPASR